jgi:transposase
MGFEPAISVAAPATCLVVLRARIGLCRLPTASPLIYREGGGAGVRAIGLVVHRDFCEVAVVEAGEVASAGRIQMTPEALQLFGGSLGSDDVVALEVSGNAFEIARIIEGHVARVLVVSGADTGIRQARAKTDRLDACALAKLVWAGSLEGLWRPDEPTRAMRRRLGRRQQLIRARTRAKNEIHAALVRRLITRPKVSDLFGQAGRAWLEGLELPPEEAETVSSLVAPDRFPDRGDRTGRAGDRGRRAQVV